MNTTQIQKTLMQELGLENLSQEKQEEIIVKMGELILKRMFIQTVDRLDEEGKIHFEKMLEEKRTPEEIEEFLKVKIENYEETLHDIVVKLKEEMKEELGEN